MLFYWTRLLHLAGVCGMYYCYSTSKYTWPLWAQNSLAELKRNQNGIKIGCSVSEGETYVPLNYKGLQFTGTSDSFVRLAVESSTQVLFNDYSIILFAKSGTPVGGTLFHYRATNKEPNKIIDIILWYNQSYITVETYGYNGENLGKIATPFGSSAGTWMGFGISYDVSKPELKLLNTESIEVSVTTITSSLLGQPGTIRIGNSYEKTRPGFLGNLICANMYAGKIAMHDFPTIQSECSQSVWPATVITGSNPQQSCPYLKNYFEMKQNDMQVHSAVSSLDNMKNSSRVQCGDFCMKTAQCTSFTFNKNTGLCLLYDSFSDVLSNFTSSVGTAFYKRRDICC